MTDAYKVLPFTGPQGDVQGHEITRHAYPWLKTPIKSVVFETFDRTAEMSIEILIHWTNWMKYAKKTWPGGGSIKAVILEDGTRVHAEARHMGFYDDAAYLAAPIHARGVIGIHANGYPLLEVTGAREWAYSKRDAEATAKYLACPWARDNAAFEARHGKTA